MSRTWKSRVGVLALTATMGIGIVGLASPAGAAGNTDNAKACQKGGFVNYSRTDGTTFKNAGDCTSYLAHGGTLVALPDLVPVVTCDTTECRFGVRNVGLGPITNADIVLQVTGTTSPVGAAVALGGGNVGDCTNIAFLIIDFGPPFSNTFICSGVTLQPGQAYNAGTFALVTFTSSVQSANMTAQVDPSNNFAESNETNNTLTQTFTAA
jgi:CARDB